MGIRKLVAVGLLAGIAALAVEVQAATFTVTNAADTNDGVCDRACSLREAITAANRTPLGAEIRFDLPAPYRIDLQSALPPLRSHLVLDGATQEGAECPLPIVHLDGSMIDSEGPVNGLEVFGDHNRVRGLVITNFSGHGIVVNGDENHLQCLFVGLDPTGTVAQGNGGHGIAVIGGHSNHVGGPEVEDGNVLSANGGHGLYIEDALNTYRQNNAVGLDILGNPKLPNGDAALPAINPSPAPPPMPDPTQVEVINRNLERGIARVTEQNGQTLETAGLYEKYAPLVEEDPPPANLSELITVLSRYPDLYGQFTRDAAAVLAEARGDEAASLDRLGSAYRHVSPSLGRAVPARLEEQGDLLEEILARFSPDEYVVSGPPSAIVAIPAKEVPNIKLLKWHLLRARGVESFDAPDFAGPYIDTCLGALGPCTWPLAYDLWPPHVHILWESSLLTQQDVEDIVEENGYFLELRVNGQLLVKGSPFGQSPLQGYWAASVPYGDPCPTGKTCLGTSVQVSGKLENVPMPWTFELTVKRLTPLEVPVFVGIDEFGNLIIATHEALVIDQSTRMVQPNPVSGGLHWFTEALYTTFKHPRCTECHGFENPNGVAAHHAGAVDLGPDFIAATNLHLEPSGFVPGAHVMACDSCHIVPLTDKHGVPFKELEWLAPYFDLDTNWGQKSSAQICARVRANLPTFDLIHTHFHGDGRLFWAIEDPHLPGQSDEPDPAPPNDFDEFLRRVDIWNWYGAPCP